MEEGNSFDRVFLVLSGKGGVGKSSVAVQLALSLMQTKPKARVGLLDIDLCGPSIPRMLGLSKAKVIQGPRGWIPVEKRIPRDRNSDSDSDEEVVEYTSDGSVLLVMSIGFLLARPDDAVVWRGPKKNAMISQFVKSVAWGHLDFLVVDTPPGTSDEHLAIADAFLSTNQPNIASVIVTTPQLVALADVEKEITFCKTVGLPLGGIIENMSGYQCPHCQHCTRIFSSGGGQQLAQKYSIPLLATLPINPQLSRILEHHGNDLFKRYSRSPMASHFAKVLEKLLT